MCFSSAFRTNAQFGVTYTSCEGHNDTDAAIPKDECHVGIIPRCEAEQKAMLPPFKAAAACINQGFSDAPIEGLVMDHSLGDPAIDPYLNKKENACWSHYFTKENHPSTAGSLTRPRLFGNAGIR